MKMRNGKLTVIIAIVGALLIALAAGLMIFDTWHRSDSAKKAPDIVSEMYTLMPEVHDSVPMNRVDNTMPAMQLDGQNFVGILEVPMCSAALPIGSEWDNDVMDFPCRYTGSVYDVSLIIGGRGDAGQFGFTADISLGDRVMFTDTAGARYTYTVADIEKTDDVSLGNLSSGNFDLVLFARDEYGFEYTVVRCSTGK